MCELKNIVCTSDLTAALATLHSYGLSVKKATLTDRPKALVALRTYGLSEKDALHTLAIEEILVEDFDRNNQKSLAPELIEIFGAQHVIDALNYAYLFLEDFDLLWSEYKNVLTTLLKIYRPEELITNPEVIRFFLNKLRIKNQSIIDDYDSFTAEEIEAMTASPLQLIEDEEE